MHKLLLASFLILPSSTWALDSWTSVTQVNFAIPASSQADRGTIFNDGSNDYLYFGTKNTDYGAGVLRSSDGLTWSQVNSPGFAASGSSNPATASTLWLANFNSALFAGTASTGPASVGARIYRSTTGQAPWTLVFSSVTTSTTTDQAVSGAFAVFNSQLFTGTVNRLNGGSIWYSSLATSEGGWNQASDSINGFGSGTANEDITALKPFTGDNYLYAATAGTRTARGQIWRTFNVSVWTAALDAATLNANFSANTFGVSSLEEFNGYLYAGTINPVTGAQLWRTQTPATAASWTQVYSGDGSNTGSKDTGRFALATSTEVLSLNAISGTLYAGVSNPSTGAGVYRSTDGVTWTSAAAAGFGDVNTQSIGGFVGLGGYTYASTRNDVTPGAVYRSTAADLISPTAVSNLTALTASATSQLTLTWTAAGNDANSGTLLAGSSFYIQLSTYSTVAFSTSTPSVVVATANVIPGAFQTYIATGLVANTTYYTRVWTADPAQNFSSLSNGATMATLTLAPTPAASTFLSVYATSATVAWTQFPSGGASSTTSQGYILEAATFNLTGLGASPGNIVSSQTPNVLLSTLTVIGLTANATYYFRVGGLNWIGTSSYTALGSTVTQPSPPAAGSPVFNSITSSGMTVNWTAGTNGSTSALIYTADISTGSYPNSFSANLSSVTALTSATFGLGGLLPALTPNTTYFLQVKSTNTFFASALTSLGSTATLANAPTASSATVYFSSITLSWGASGNPSGTTYYAQVSTDSSGNFATLNLSTATLFDSLTLNGLLANTTYYLRVNAVNRNSVPTAYSQFTTTSTFVQSPSSAAPTVLSSTSLTLNWGANGNSSTTQYVAKISSDGFATALSSITTTGTSATFSGLIPNTLYFSSVQALGNNSINTAFADLPSTTTFMIAPGTNTATFTAVNTASITVTWSSGGNAPATLYVARLSTGAFPNSFSGNLSSETLNTSAVFGSGGLGADLAQNSTFYFQVFSSAGVNTSTYVSLGSTFTLTTPPALTVILAVSSVSISVDWQPNGNPEPGTGYELWRATESGFSTPTKTAVSTTTYLTSGLSAKTSYYFQVRAFNLAGLYSGFGSSTFTMTSPTPPGQPGTPAGTALGVSSISWTWTLGTDATSYYVYQSTNTSLVIGTSTTTAFSQTGLSPNTTASVIVVGVDVAGPGTASSAGTQVYTLANPPAQTSTAAATVWASSGTVSWSLNSNSAVTAAHLERSTDNASFSLLFSSVALSFTDVDILGCSTYYYRVRNQNGAGTYTSYDSTVSFVTRGSTPLAPGSLTADSIVGNKITLTWTASPFEGITSYNLYYDSGTGTVSYAAPLAVFASTETSFTTGVLISSPAYVFALRAKNRCGVEESGGAFATSAATATLADARAAISSPPSGSNIAGGASGSTALSAAASLVTGDISNVSQVVFQYKSVSASTWTVISTATALPYSVTWNVTSPLLALGSYNLRAIAYTTAGSSDSLPGSVTVNLVDPAGTAASLPGYTKETVSGLVVTKTAVISDIVSNTITATGLASDGSARMTAVRFPSAAFGANNSTATITVVNNPAIPAAAPAGANSPGIGTEITIGNGLSLASGKTATLTLSYPDTNNDGVIDGTTMGVGQMQFQSYSAGSGQWVKDIATAINTDNHTVTGITTHFTFFFIFAVPAADLSSVRVYPVPYKPNGGVANEGKPYSSGDPTSGIIFDNLPASFNIKIYTVSGQLVAQFGGEKGTGKVQWNAKNDSGRDTASGLYVAVIASPGNPSVTRKLLIIR